MKIILDNGHIMHYNNHCSAGVAHLVERDLAKVEVASSSLVARSKKKHHPNRVVFFAFTGRAEARTGHERSERNMPGACFGARVRVAARLGRQRASSPAPKRNTIPIGWCFFAFTGPPAMCSPSCRQHKSVVFLRRFCFARKMEQRERYSIICCTFFCLQPLCRRLHRR